MTIAAGAIACEIVRLLEPMVRKIMDIVKVHINEKRKYRKNGPGSRRRFVMKYNAKLKEVEVRSLDGRSQIMDAIASDAGW